MKKKLLASLLVVAMTAAMLVGCGGVDDKQTSSNQDQQTDAEEPADNKDAADDKDAADAEKPEDDAEGGSEAKNPDGKVPKDRKSVV